MGLTEVGLINGTEYNRALNLGPFAESFKHCVQIVHTMGNLPSKMRSILIIAMAERVPYWIWAILVVSNYFKE